MEDQLRNLKVFSGEILKEEKFFINEFYEFFAIPLKFRNLNESDIRKSNFNNFKISEISIEPNTDLLRNTVKSIGFKHQLRISTGETLFWTDYRREPTSLYSVYFQIFFEDFSKKTEKGKHYEFSFRIQSVLFENLNYTIEARYSDFVKLASKLKKNLTVTPPALPQKTYIVNSEENMMKRARGLSEWILVVANEKFYQCLELFSFLQIPRDKVNAYMNYTPILKLYEKFQYEIRIEKSVDTTNENVDDTFKLYFIRVKINDKEMLNLISGYIVKRRYREFDHLNKELKKKFKRYVKKIPDLPSKFNFDKSKSRKFQLETYLNELIKYPDIWDCVYVRKFLQLNPMRFNEFNI